MPADLAVEVITHLFFRTDAIRDLISETFLTVQRAKVRMTTPAAMLAFIGANNRKPGPRFDQFVEIMQADPRWPITFGGRPLRQARMMLFKAVRSDPAKLVSGSLAESTRELEFLLREHSALSREAHVNALSGYVDAPPDPERFGGLAWSVVDYPDEDLPLPDTVVLASRDGKAFSSAPWVDRQSCQTVIMPLGSQRLLQGRRVPGPTLPATLLHAALVEGARAFVRRRSIEGFDPAAIGRGDQAALDRIIDETLSDLFTRPIGSRTTRLQID